MEKSLNLLFLLLGMYLWLSLNNWCIGSIFIENQFCSFDWVPSWFEVTFCHTSHGRFIVCCIVIIALYPWVYCVMLQAFFLLLFLCQMFMMHVCVCVCVCVCVSVCVCFFFLLLLFIDIVQRNLACLTWKSAIEIKSLLLLLLSLQTDVTFWGASASKGISVAYNSIIMLRECELDERLCSCPCYEIFAQKEEGWQKCWWKPGEWQRVGRRGQCSHRGGSSSSSEVCSWNIPQFSVYLGRKSPTNSPTGCKVYTTNN